MRSTHTVFGTAIHGARGVLPWITLLALASALASSMSSGVSDLPGMREVRASGRSDLGGNRLLYVGLDTWIPAEPRRSGIDRTSQPGSLV